MTIASKVKIAAIALLVAIASTFGVGWLSYQTARADTPHYVVHAFDKPVELVAQADTGSGSQDGAAGAPTAKAGEAPTGSPTTPAAPTASPTLPEPPSIDQLTKLWRGGAFLVAGILTLYLLLTLAMKLDKRHAFYIAAGLAGVGVLVDAINRGETPTLGMMIAAFGTIVSIIIKGPEKKS